MTRNIITSFFIVPAMVLCSNISTAQTLDACSEHSLHVCSDSIARSWGRSTNGQLGLGVTSNKGIPTAIPTLSGIKAVAAGHYFSLFLKGDGTVWATGANTYGQLGQGNTTAVDTPIQILSLSNITAISAGSGHSLFLKNDGTVWSCGLNTNGQLGNGTTSDEWSPIQVPGLTNVSAVCAGGNHSLFLMNDGTVKACGLNVEGQLGQGMISFGLNSPTGIPSLSGITKIDAGWSFSIFLKNDGTVWGCGGNDSGVLGNGTTTDQSTPVQSTALLNIIHFAASAHSDHALFLKNDGTVWVCGSNGSGRLGLGTTTNVSTAVQNTAVTGVVDIAAGGNHSLFIKNDGTGMATGGNFFGQLGIGSFVSTTSPMAMANLCPAVTGINEENMYDAVSIYPNPASAMVNIGSETPIESIQVYNSTGTLVQTAYTNSFSVEQLPAGIYLVKTITAKGTGINRLVKQ